jgi:hypothetical protein
MLVLPYPHVLFMVSDEIDRLSLAMADFGTIPFLF